MKKLLIFLMWLLGLAVIAWLCGRMNSGSPATAAMGAAPAAVATPQPPPPPAVAAPAAVPAPEPAKAPQTPAATSSPSAPPTPPTPAQVASTRIDDVLKDKVIEFRSGSATLTGVGNRTLEEIARVLKEDPSLKFQVQGHTDSVGGAAINQALSEARANSVKDALARLGVAPGRMTARGFGATQPVADNSTDEGRARNRRIAFSIEENK